jgi:repressor LexA
MVSLPPLSPRQQQILRLISQFITRHGLPPTRADLAQALQLRNRQGIDQHLRALEHKGYLRLEPGIARGIRLLIADSPLGAAADMAAHSSLLPLYGRVAAGIPRQSTLLPLYGRVAAGIPTLAESNIEEEIAIDRDLFRPRPDFLLRVHGLSMRDAGIAHRDILAVHRLAEARNGQIVVARLGDEATVKYYHRHGPLLRLEPANPEFMPIQIDLRRDSCEIEGIVVGVVRTELPRRVQAST